MKLRSALAALVATMAFMGPAQAQGRPCDRACLRTTLDGFLGAVVAHDPGRTALDYVFRQTENAVLTPAGGGIWQSITALGVTQRRYVDPVTGNALYFGTIREGDKTAIASLRVKVDHGKVSEAEWNIVRKSDRGITGDPGATPFDPDRLARTPPVERVVPRGDRLPRETLIGIVNGYFDGITAQSGRTVMGEPGCVRLENGLEVTGHPLRDANDIGLDGKADCRSGYAGLNIANVAARRYLMVDEEAQVVVASAVFLRVPGNPKHRNYFMELFAIDHGKLHLIHSAMLYADPALPLPNWPPYDGNFQVPPTVRIVQ